MAAAAPSLLKAASSSTPTHHLAPPPLALQLRRLPVLPLLCCRVALQVLHAQVHRVAAAAAHQAGHLAGLAAPHLQGYGATHNSAQAMCKRQRREGGREGGQPTSQPACWLSSAPKRLAPAPPNIVAGRGGAGRHQPLSLGAAASLPSRSMARLRRPLRPLRPLRKKEFGGSRRKEVR